MESDSDGKKLGLSNHIHFVNQTLDCYSLTTGAAQVQIN